MNLEEFINKTNKAKNVDLLFEDFETAMGELGFDRLLLALMNDHPALKKEAEHGVIKNYPDGWVNYYLAQGYDEIDPVRTLSFTRTGTYTWDEITGSKTLTNKQRLMFNQAEEAKLFNGVGVALHGGGGAVAALGAASSEKGIDLSQPVLDKVNLMSYQFYTCFWRLMESDISIIRQNLLSDREQEILKWCAKGYTKIAISERLNLSVHTVDSHVRNSMRKLDSKNITSTVVKAINLGFIHI